MRKNFRVKCARHTTVNGHVDLRVCPGKFYDVTSVEKSINGVEYFTVTGEGRESAEVPSHFFEPPKRKRFVRAHA